MPTEEFCERLNKFFLQFPRDFGYAVEIRNPGFLGMGYLQVLLRHGVAHVYNHWSDRPLAKADESMCWSIIDLRAMRR